MEEEWKSGFPVMPGWYRCRIDGEEITLKHYICEMRNRHHWLDESGEYVNEEVEWMGERLAA